MHDLVLTLIDAVDRVGLAQLPHPLAAAIGLYIGRTYPPRWRLALWLCLAALFLGAGAAGFRWGKPGLPLLLSVIVEDRHLFRPIPGLIELGTADHVLELLFGAAFAFGSAVTALELALRARRESALEAALSEALAGAARRDRLSGTSRRR